VKFDWDFFDQLGHRGIKCPPEGFPPYVMNDESIIALKYESRDHLIISFDPSVTQLVEEIPVKLHLTGKSRLTV
jgi:hypothetical protein